MATVAAFANPGDQHFMDWTSFKSTGTIPSEISRATIQATLDAAREELAKMFPDTDMNTASDEPCPEWAHLEDSLLTGSFVDGVFIGPGEPTAPIERANAVEPDDDVEGIALGVGGIALDIGGIALAPEASRKRARSVEDIYDLDTEQDTDEPFTKYQRHVHEEDEFYEWLESRPEYSDASQEQRSEDDDFIAALEKNGVPYSEIKTQLMNEWRHMFDDVLEISMEKLENINMNTENTDTKEPRTGLTQSEFWDWLDNHPTHKACTATRMRDLDYAENAERDGVLTYDEMVRQIEEDWEKEGANPTSPDPDEATDEATDKPPSKDNDSIVEFFGWLKKHPFHADADSESRQKDLKFVQASWMVLSLSDIQKQLLERWSSEAQEHYEPPSP